MNSLRRNALVLCVCFLATAAAYSGESPDEQMKTTAVAAFKNGLAFVTKQGDIRLENGMATIKPIPAATLGSLWIAPNDSGATLEEAVALRYKVSTERNLTSVAEVLLANPGKTVTITDNNQKEITGTVVGFKEQPAITPEPIPLPMNSSYGYSSGVPIVPQPKPIPEFLMLQTEGRVLAIRFTDIYRIVLPKDPVLQSKLEEERKALRVKVRGASGHTNMTMGYLEHGMGWTPSYLISLQDDKSAQITMQAVLTNDAEDIKDADVYFVVGVPNFEYSGLPSPMALQQSLYEFMQAVSTRDRMRGASGGIASNALMSQRAAVLNDNEAAADFGAVVNDLAGAPQEDLFLYTRKDVTLDRGQRGSYNVFSGNVNYEHIYEWNVQDQPRVDGFGNVQNQYQNQGTPDQSVVNNVWHSLRIKNTTNFPWTSAPAMVIQGTKPLSQDTIPYTPKGATSNLKITIATDIRSSHEEREIARQQNVERRRGYQYDLVTVEGTLKAKNYKTREVHLSITKKLRGNVDSQTENGTAEKLAESISVDNAMSQLKWEIVLKPGEEKTLMYRYKVWVRV